MIFSFVGKKSFLLTVNKFIAVRYTFGRQQYLGLYIFFRPDCIASSPILETQRHSDTAGSEAEVEAYIIVRSFAYFGVVDFSGFGCMMVGDGA